MELSNSDLLNFAGRIKLRQKKKSDYSGQVDNLISTVETGIKEHTDMHVTRVLRTGSWRKGTALRPSGDRALDIDIVFFLDIEESSAKEIQTLQDTMLDFLVKAYPNKKRSDFEGGEKTIGLVFRGSGLEADLVPVVPLSSKSDFVWQPSKKKTTSPFVTSIDGQLEFIRGVKEIDSNYTSVVRMLKEWRSRKELPSQLPAVPCKCTRKKKLPLIL